MLWSIWRKQSNDNHLSGSDGCYLTTACVVANHLPDDCDELQTLRRYRDTYLKNKRNGNADIMEYYSIAPKIVSSINAADNSTAIWSAVYAELILPCVQMIKTGNYEEAYALYKNYTYRLRAQYCNM